MNDPLPYGSVVPPRGWYPDPATPGRDRWWTGQEWGTSSVRTPQSLFGVDYARRVRPGPGSPARLAQIAVVVQAVALIVLITFALHPDFVSLRPWSIVPAVAFVLGTAGAFVFGILGIARAQSHGGLAVSIIAVSVSTLYLVISVFAAALGMIVFGPLNR